MEVKPIKMRRETNTSRQSSRLSFSAFLSTKSFRTILFPIVDSNAKKEVGGRTFSLSTTSLYYSTNNHFPSSFSLHLLVSIESQNLTSFVGAVIRLVFNLARRLVCRPLSLLILFPLSLNQRTNFSAAHFISRPSLVP